MEKWRIEEARKEIAKYPELRAALAVAEIGHEGQQMKLPEHMASQGMKMSFLEHHVIEMYLIARAVGLNPELRPDRTKLACVLLHDVVEDSDKQAARNVPENKLINSRGRLEKIYAEKLSECGCDSQYTQRFSGRVAEVVAEDTNLDLLFESKRTTQVVRARSGMSDVAKLLKQLDVTHHMMTAITLPPTSLWTNEKRLATVFKGYEVGRSCSTGIKQLDNLVELLAFEAAKAVIKDTDGVGNSGFDLFSLLDKASGYTRIRNGKHHHSSSRPLFMNRVMEHGIKGIYLNDDMKVCAFASVVNPAHNFKDNVNSLAEKVRDEFERKLGMEQPIATGDLVFDDSQYFRVMHLDKPMDVQKFVEVASGVKGALCPELADKIIGASQAAANDNFQEIQCDKPNIVRPTPAKANNSPTWLPLAGITLLLSAVGYLSKGNKQKKQLEEASVKQSSLSAFSIPLK